MAAAQWSGDRAQGGGGGATPATRAKSLVIGTDKQAGIHVRDLSGERPGVTSAAHYEGLFGCGVDDRTGRFSVAGKNAGLWQFDADPARVGYAQADRPGATARRWPQMPLDNDTAPATQNFKYADWATVRQALKLR